MDRTSPLTADLWGNSNSSGNGTQGSLFGNLTVYEATVVTASFPTFAMILGSALVLYCRPTAIVKACLQNLSAGIILAAISGELFPLLTTSGGIPVWEHVLAIIIGFIGGLGLMFGLDIAMDKCAGDDNDSDDADGERSAAASISGTQRLLESGHNEFADIALGADLQAKVMKKIEVIHERMGQLLQETDRTDMDFIVHEITAAVDECKRMLRYERTVLSELEHAGLVAPLISYREELCSFLSQEKVTKADFESLLSQLEASMRGFHEAVEQPAKWTRRWRDTSLLLPRRDSIVSEKLPFQPIPWGLVLAVSVDAFVDGFLIGLSYVGSPQAGLVMAGATCVEMGFVGVSYSASLLSTGRPMGVLVWILLCPPFFLLFSGFIAGLVGSAVEGTAFFTGFISLAIVALFFLVTQELLLEAHENLNGRQIPAVNMMLFVGILLIIIVQNVIG